MRTGNGAPQLGPSIRASSQDEPIQRSMKPKTMNRVWGPPERLRRGVGRSIRRTGAAALPLILLLAIGCAERSREAVGTRGDELRRFEPRWSHDPPWHPCDLPQVPGLRLVTCAPAPSLLADVENSKAGDTRFRAIEELSASSFETEAIRRSVARLREERLRRRDDATVENDLAVALVVAAQAEASPVMLVQALGAIERARRLTPESEVVGFNRALIVDYLHLTEAAEEAWQDYLRLDAESAWSAEARERLERVRSRRAAGSVTAKDPAVDDPQRERHRLEVVVLAEWAGMEDPAQARAFLEEQMPAVKRLAVATGDDYLLLTYRHLLKAYGRAEVAQRELREGHHLLAEARRAQDERSFAQSLPLLRQARSLLHRNGDPFWVWAEHGILRCAYQRSDFTEMEQIGSELLEATPRGSAIAARTWWVLGSGRFARGDFAAAQEAFRAASAIFANLGEELNQIAMESMLAPLFEWIGRRDAAWEARHAVLAHLGDGRDPRRLRLVLVEAASAAENLAELDAALALQDLAVKLAEEEDEALPLANALLKRGSLFADAPVPDLERAEADFSRSAELVGRVADPSQRASLETQLLLEWGTSELTNGDAVGALRRLSDAVLTLEKGDAPRLWLPEANLALGRALAAAGDHAAAESRLRLAIEELRRQRLTAEGVNARVALADRMDEAHDELLRLLLDRGDSRLALESVRQARLESWQTRIADHSSSEIGPSQPPEGATRLTYAILADRLAIWSQADSELRLFQRRVPRQNIEALLASVRATIASRTPGSMSLLRDLHRLLIEPAAEELVSAERLVIEPDESLFGVPFAALLDAEGSFLVERHSIVITIPGRETGEVMLRRTPRRLLSVADPAFAEKRYPHLERLPAAAAEAEALAAQYPEAVLLVGSDATPARVLSGLKDAQVVHLAAHGLFSSQNPLLSSLLLASDDSSADGVLTVANLLEVELAAGPIVVLAVCESIGGAFAKADGPLGLAWPFLTNGASSVVATLWQIDDKEAAELVLSLHGHLSRGGTAEEALRAAQVELIAAGKPPHVWAPWLALT